MESQLAYAGQWFRLDENDWGRGIGSGDSAHSFSRSGAPRRNALSFTSLFLTSFHRKDSLLSNLIGSCFTQLSKMCSWFRIICPQSFCTHQNRSFVCNRSRALMWQFCKSPRLGIAMFHSPLFRFIYSPKNIGRKYQIYLENSAFPAESITVKGLFSINAGLGCALGSLEGDFIHL